MGFSVKSAADRRGSCLSDPAVGAKPVTIGTRQLIVSILFTILFIITWR
jgi:hypothetical protein